MGILAIIMVISLIILDQIVKYWALVVLKPIGSITVINGFFALTYVENRGAAYGSFSEHTAILAVLSLVMSLGIIYVIRNFDKYFSTKYVKWGLYLTLAGALGNFIDRAFRTFVVDMFQFTFIDFPVFNVADICVVIGAVIIIIAVLIFEKD